MYEFDKAAPRFRVTRSSAFSAPAESALSGHPAAQPRLTDRSQIRRLTIDVVTWITMDEHPA
jgi:hypothetical protein